MTEPYKGPLRDYRGFPQLQETPPLSNSMFGHPSPQLATFTNALIQIIHMLIEQYATKAKSGKSILSKATKVYKKNMNCVR